MNIIETGGISEMDETKFKNILVCILCFALGFASSYILFGSTSVPSNGAGDVVIKEQIKGSQNTAGAISDSVQRAESTNRRLESSISNTGNAISDIEQILRGVEQRGKVEAK